MAQDIYSRTVELGGSFSSDGAKFTFGTFQAGFLVQQIQYQYQQNISRVYELGSPKLFLVAGRTQGSASVARILGPEKLAKAFYRSFGDVCDIRTNSIRITMETGCGGGAPAKDNLTLQHAVIQSINGSVSAQEFLLNEQIQLMYLWLQLNDGQA